MTGREHVMIGAGTTALALGSLQMAAAGIDILALWPPIVAAAAGSLAPDLDHPWSLASMSIPVTLIVYSTAFLGVRAYETANPGNLFELTTLAGPAWVSAAWASLVLGVALLVLSVFICRAFGHRGLVHSVGFCVGASCLVAVGLSVIGQPVWLTLPFAWGWAAHLLADATTPAGLRQPLWPLVRS